MRASRRLRAVLRLLMAPPYLPSLFRSAAHRMLPGAARRTALQEGTRARWQKTHPPHCAGLMHSPKRSLV